MGNLATTIKRFIQNKNTVTILAVLAGVILLWYFYNYRVNQAITTISIPYAVESIDTTKKIEEDNIKTKEINQSILRDNDLVENISELQGKYVCKGTSIPANGFIHHSQICDEKELPSSVLKDIPDGYTIYGLTVNSKTTYANSIAPGDYIDLYLLAPNVDGKILYGRLIESIEVKVVRDSSGKDVFWDSSAGESAQLLFAVPNDYANLLRIAESLNVTIEPRLRNASFSENPIDTNISSENLYWWVMNQASLEEN